MIKTKRILMAKRIEHAVNEKLKKETGTKMSREEIDREINMQKIHNARTKRAMSNLNNNEKILARYGGMYTQAEINLLQDLHPYLKETETARTGTEKLNKDENLELLKQLNMFTKYAEDDDYLMI